MKTVKVLGIVGRKKPFCISQSVQVGCADYEPTILRYHSIGFSQKKDLLLGREVFYHVKQQGRAEARILEGQAENIPANLPIYSPSLPIHGQIVRIEVDADVVDLR